MNSGNSSNRGCFALISSIHHGSEIHFLVKPVHLKSMACIDFPPQVLYSAFVLVEFNAKSNFLLLCYITLSNMSVPFSYSLIFSE